MTDTDVVELFSARASKRNHSARHLRGACFALADWMARNERNLGLYDWDELISIGSTMLSHTGGRMAVRRDGVRHAARRLFRSRALTRGHGNALLREWLL